jgi:hypothetical protein
MKFPSLETMVAYGIYTIQDLVLHSHGKLQRRNVVPLNECQYCSFVFPGTVCTNCSSS